MDRKELLEKELVQIKEKLISNYNPESIILFGSLASGKIHEWSDIDLAIVKNTKTRFIDRIGEILKLLRPKISINVFVYTPEEVKKMESEKHYFWLEEIIHKGKVLYERSV